MSAMKIGSETNSLVNHVMSAENVRPVVGMGCTILMWTDRHAATIVRVTNTQVHVQQDRAKRIDTNGMSESQKYEYTSDPTSPVKVFRMTKRGWRNANGDGLGIGYRNEYHDFSF